MKFIRNLLKYFVHEVPKPLGRWRMEECDKKTNYKIDCSNEDHCGPCGQYIAQKVNVTNEKK